MSSNNHRTPAGAAALAAGLALAACGSSSTSGSSTTTPPASMTSAGMPTATSPSVVTPSATPTMSQKPTASSTITDNIPLCTSNIRVIPGQSQGAAGHLTLVLIFNNVGHAPCRILGYPKVDLVTASGSIVQHAAHTLSGMAGGANAIASVTLAAGASASALVEGSDVPRGPITNCGSYSLMVTPPNQAVAVGAGTAMMPRCDLQVHPVVVGTGGGMR